MQVCAVVSPAVSGVVKVQMEFEKKLVHVHTEMGAVQVRGRSPLWRRVSGWAGVGCGCGLVLA